MGMTDDATIRLKLDASQARAEYAKFLAEARGATVGIGATGGPGTPGGGGPGSTMGGSSILSSILGNPIAATGAALGGMAALPIVGDALGGVAGYVGQFGHNVSEMTGLGAFNRAGHVREKAEDLAFAWLGSAANFTTRDQNIAMYDLAKSITKFRTDAEDKFRSDIGAHEVKDTTNRLADAIDRLIEFLAGSRVSSAVPSTVDALTAGMSHIGRGVK